jgi:hypothetical protein
VTDPVGAGIHLKTGDRVAVLDAMAKAAERSGLVPTTDAGNQAQPGTELRVAITPARAGWTSVYVEQTWRAPSLASALARAAKTPALLVRLAGDWACAYQAYDGDGRLGDAYHSCPDADKAADEDDASADEIERTRGDAGQLGATLGGGQGLEGVGEVLRTNRIDRLRDHDAAGGHLPDPDAVFVALQEAFGLPNLRPDFDEVRHFLADEEGLDLVLRAFKQGEAKDDPPPPPESAAPAKKRGWRLFGRRRAKTGADDAEPAADDDETGVDDDET